MRIFAFALTLAFSTSSFAQSHSRHSQTNGQQKSASAQAHKGTEESVIKESDCREGLSEIDVATLLEIESELKKLKNLYPNPDAFNKRAQAVVKEKYETLGPQARALFVQQGIKAQLNTLQLNSEEQNKNFKRALDEYMTWSDFHVKQFGPGGTYPSMGVFDKLFGKSGDLWLDSVKRVNAADLQLMTAAYAELKAGRISEKEYESFSKAMLEHRTYLSDRNKLLYKANEQRLAASKKSVLLTGAALAATVVTGGLASGTLGAAWGTAATTAAIGGTSGFAGTIFAGQTKMLAEAAASGGDVGCAFAIKAIEGNDQLAKDALVNGVIGAIAGGGIGRLLAKGGKYASRTVTALKSLTAVGVTAGSFGTGKNASLAYENYSKAREFAEKSDAAFKAGDNAQASSYAKLSEDYLKSAHKFTINTSETAVTTALAAVGFRSLGNLKNQFAKAENVLKKPKSEFMATANEADFDDHIDFDYSSRFTNQSANNSKTAAGHLANSDEAQNIGLPQKYLDRARANGGQQASKNIEFLASPKGQANTEKLKNAIAKNHSDLGVSPDEGILLLEGDANFLDAARELKQTMISQHGAAPIIINGHGSPRSIVINEGTDGMFANNSFGGLQLTAIMKKMGIPFEGKDVIMLSCHGGTSCGLSQVLPSKVFTAPYSHKIHVSSGQFVLDPAIKPSLEWKKAIEQFDGDLDRASNLYQGDALFFEDGKLH